MALFNEILQGRQQNLLTKLLNMVGGSPMPQLAPELQASWSLDNYDHDSAAMQGVRWCLAGDTIAAGGAGNYSQLGIAADNSVGPLGCIVVLKSIVVSSATTQDVFLQRISAPTATLSTQKRHQDFRVDAGTISGQPPPVSFRAGITATAPGVGVCGIYKVLANTNVVIPLHVVLTATAPGCYFGVISRTANLDLAATFEFYYRIINPSEETL